MLKVIFFTAAMFWSASAFAQSYSISGVIRDENSGQVLEGATIQLMTDRRIVVSDAFGKFTIGSIASGEHELQIRFLGYQDRSVKLSVPGEALDIRLKEATMMTDEVVVYATRANEKTPTTFTNVSALSLQKQNFGQDLPLLLNWTPSLVTTSDAGAGVGYTGLRIRGSDATRINVTINGIPYNDSESHSTYWVDVPDVAASTQSVQIQRGVGTSTNGGGSFGGSVNVQTNSLQAEPYATLTAGGGSFNTQRYAVKAGTGLFKNHWAFDGRASKIKSDGYVDRASSDLNSYYLSAGYYGKKTLIKAITFGGHERTYQSWNGIDGPTMATNRTFNSAGALYDPTWTSVLGYYDNEVDDYRQDHYQLHLTQQLSDIWNANVSLHYTYGRGYYEQYKQDKPFSELGLSDLVLSDTTLTYGDFIVRRWLDNKFYGTTFSFNREGERSMLTVGGAFNQYAHARHFGEIIWGEYASNSSIRQHYYDGASTKNDFNIYAKWNVELTDVWSAFVDLQYRTVDYRTTGTDDSLAPYEIADQFHFFNPKAGISYKASSTDMLYASYAIANREPNRTDYLDSDVKPKPEQLGDFEMGWRRKNEKFNLEVNYYLMNYTDQLVLTGRLDNVGNPIRANVGKSYRTGIEVNGAVRFSDNLIWNANATWSSNKNIDYVWLDENGSSITRTTKIILSPSLIAGSQLTWSVLKDLQVTLLQKVVGRQYLDNTESETLQLDAYMLHDVRFSYSLPVKGMKGIDLSLLMNNIFDVQYASNGYSYDGTPYYFPQAGINFLGMMTLKF